MNSSNIVLYPRGFIGFDTGLITDKATGVNMDEWVKSIKLNKPIMEPVSPYKGIPQVDAIWNEYQSGTKLITSFDFRESIIKTALMAFGTQSFFAWCELQTKNIYLTALHRKFLNDTFQFIESGKRSISNTTWQSLIKMREASVQDAEVPYALNEFFRINGPNTAQRSFRTTDIIAQWVTQEEGFDDLLSTIHILFGTD